jgi:hypothetical protein
MMDKTGLKFQVKIGVTIKAADIQASSSGHVGGGSGGGSDEIEVNFWHGSGIVRGKKQSIHHFQEDALRNRITFFVIGQELLDEFDCGDGDDHFVVFLFQRTFHFGLLDALAKILVECFALVADQEVVGFLAVFFDDQNVFALVSDSE